MKGLKRPFHLLHLAAKAKHCWQGSGATLEFIDDHGQANITAPDHMELAARSNPWR